MNTNLRTDGFRRFKSNVTLKPLANNDTGLQQWEIGEDDDSGFFTIKNSASGKFLTADHEGNPKIKGTYLI